MAGSVNFTTPELLFEITEFLSTYSYLYNFRWVDNDGKVNIEQAYSALNNHKPHWITSMPNFYFNVLQALVKGDDVLLHDDLIPSDLLDFAKKCQRYTQTISNWISLKQSPTPMAADCLSFNRDSSTVDFIMNSSSSSARHQFKGVKPKKEHEIRRMARLIVSLLLESKGVAGGVQIRPAPPKRPFDRETFQTAPLVVDEHVSGKNVEPVQPPPPKQRSPANVGPISTLVDIGSGLGHLPSLVAKLWSSNDGNIEPLPPLHIYAVESDKALHSKAAATAEDNVNVSMPSSNSVSIERIHFRLNTRNGTLLVDNLKRRMNEKGQNLPTTSPVMMSGLHCCGDLSINMIRTFLSDPTFNQLLLVGCCYHKMTTKQHHGPGTAMISGRKRVDTISGASSGLTFSSLLHQKFPASSTLQSALSRTGQSHHELNKTATLRLACQWSPSQWLDWTCRDANKHQLGLVVKQLLGATHNSSMKPEALTRVISESHLDYLLNIDDLVLAPVWQLHLALNCPLSHVGPDNLSALYSTLDRTWSFSRILLALQQLLQPLLEALVLADRLWLLTETPQIAAAGYVRLFEPRRSPRCMALWACKVPNDA